MNIKNETLKKLTANEIGELGLCNEGVGLYKGELKTRKNGYKTIRVDEDEVHFIRGEYRIEFVRIAATLNDATEWAARIRRNDSYETYPMGIAGCYFFK